jgi:hypothetical protein
MAIKQTRPYEESLYDGSLDPSNVMIVVDFSGWSRPKRYALESIGVASGGGGTSQIETGRLTGLSSNFVEESFGSSFSDIPIGRKNLHVYRIQDLGGGKTIDLTIPIYGLTVTTDGFSFYIDDDESLTGIIVEFLFIL